MLDPFFFDGDVNRQSYLNLFQNQVHENQFQRLWWDQDRAPYCELLASYCQLFGERLSLHNLHDFNST